MRGGLWGVGLEGDLRNTETVRENCPLPQKENWERIPLSAGRGRRRGLNSER